MDNGAMERDWDARARQDAKGTLPVRNIKEKRSLQKAPGKFREFCDSFFQREGFQSAGKRMLDIGCGIGRMERGFAEMFGEVWGLDVSGEMIAQAKELNRQFEKIKFVKGSGQDLSIFTGEYFDFVFSYITLQHIPDKKIIFNYLSEIYRVLKPGGLYKVLIRKEWAGFTFLFGFIPVPRFLFRYIPESVWSIYDRLAYRNDKVPCRGRTYRGSGVSEKEAIQVMHSLGFAKVEIEEDPCKVSYWCYGKK